MPKYKNINWCDYFTGAYKKHSSKASSASSQPPTNGAFSLSSGSENSTLLGKMAKEVLKNPAIDAAFKKIEADIFLAWKTSSPADKEKRENLYYRMEGLSQIKVKLQGMVINMAFEEKKNLKSTSPKGSAEGE